MTDGKMLLNQLETDLQAVAGQTAARETALTDQYHESRQSWHAWHARWTEQLTAVNRRRQERLADHLKTANAVVEVDKELEKTTAGLRQWLQATEVLIASNQY